MIATNVTKKIPANARDLIRAGSFLKENELSLGVLGRTAARMKKTTAARAAIIRNALLHPVISPIVLPKGRPAIIANEEPDTTMLRAAGPFPSGATLTARGVTIDQNMAWEHATPILEIISML